MRAIVATLMGILPLATLALAAGPIATQYRTVSRTATREPNKIIDPFS